MPPNDPHYLVTLKAEGPGPPAILRLRRWLKHALRCHGLRAVRVEELPPAPAAAPAANRDGPAGRPGASSIPDGEVDGRDAGGHQGGAEAPRQRPAARAGGRPCPVRDDGRAREVIGVGVGL
jgi:hypothetical protein